MPTKTQKLYPFEKLLTLMISGEPVTIEEIDSKLGQEIYTYRLSTYMWHIKTNANGVVKSIKEGRKVVAYQLVNVKEVQKYMNRVGIDKCNYVPGAIVKKPSKSKLSKPVKTTITKLNDLDAVPVASEQVIVPEVVESASEVFEITEIQTSV